MKALEMRFAALGKPLPAYKVVEYALERLYREYCLYASETAPEGDRKAEKLLKVSVELMAARYPEFKERAAPVSTPRSAKRVHGSSIREASFAVR